MGTKLDEAHSFQHANAGDPDGCSGKEFGEYIWKQIIGGGFSGDRIAYCSIWNRRWGNQSERSPNQTGHNGSRQSHALSRDFRLGLTYANTYSPPGAGLGSTTGQNFGPAIGRNLANSTAGTGVVANLYGMEGFYKVSPGFAVNGWVGYSAHHYLGRGDGQVWDWAVGLAFPDLWKKANLGGLFVGMEPKLTGLSRSVNLGAGFGRADRDTSLHIEGFYQYQLTDNIAITPGVIWVTAPDFDNRNADTVIGWLRTTFRF